MNTEESKPLNGSQLDPPPEVVYVKEKPFLRVLLGLLVLMVGCGLFLYLAGVVLGYTGHDTPTFDKDAISQKFNSDSLVINSYDECINEGGTLQDEEYPPICSFDGVEFSPITEPICSDTIYAQYHVSECVETPAEIAGKKTGEVYSNGKDYLKEFVKGFNDARKNG